VTGTGRTRRRSRPACPSSVSGCTGCHVSSWRWIRSWGSAAPPSPALGSAWYVGSDLDETYLSQAVSRTRGQSSIGHTRTSVQPGRSGRGGAN
jgi:hypothetical protein